MNKQARSVLPFKLAATEEHLTANAGLALFGEFVRGLGVLRWVKQELPEPGSARGYLPQDYVQPLILMLTGGGCSLEDLRQIYRDTGLRHLLKAEQTPSTDAFGDWLRRMGAGSGLTGLSRVNRRVVAQRLRQMTDTRHTLDIDATQIVAEKQAAHFTYKGVQGYMPMVGHLAEAEVIVHQEFREGNASPLGDNLGFIKSCEAAMPKGHSIRRLRADAATYQAEVMNYCNAQSIEFAIAARLDETVKATIVRIADSAWKHYPDCAVAQTWHTMNHTDRYFRLVIVRRPRQGELFEEATAERYRYTVIASNMGDSRSAEDIYVWYCQRGQTSENGIKELKNGFGMRRMPCGQMAANAMYFALGVLAHNLFVLFKVVALDESWRRHQVQTLRWRLFHQAGKVVRTGRRWVLKVAKDVLGLFEQIRNRAWVLSAAPA